MAKCQGQIRRRRAKIFCRADVDKKMNLILKWSKISLKIFDLKNELNFLLHVGRCEYLHTLYHRCGQKEKLVISVRQSGTCHGNKVDHFWLCSSSKQNFPFYLGNLDEIYCAVLELRVLLRVVVHLEVDSCIRIQLDSFRVKCSSTLNILVTFSMPRKTQNQF